MIPAAVTFNRPGVPYFPRISFFVPYPIAWVRIRFLDKGGLLEAVCRIVVKWCGEVGNC